MYLWSLTINFMAWSHEELDGISYRTEKQCVLCARRFPSAHKIHTHPCVSSEHSTPLPSSQHTHTNTHTHIYKKKNKPTCVSVLHQMFIGTCKNCKNSSEWKWKYLFFQQISKCLFGFFMSGILWSLRL